MAYNHLSHGRHNNVIVGRLLEQRELVRYIQKLQRGREIVERKGKGEGKEKRKERERDYHVTLSTHSCTPPPQMHHLRHSMC